MNLILDTRLDASKRSFYDRLKGLPPGRYSIEIEKYEKRRSLTANAYYWAFVVTPIAHHCGYTPEQMHDEILGSYFGWEEREFRGRKKTVPRRRSSKLTTMEFQDLIHHGQQIAAELGIPVENREYGAAA